ncbi:MULTISPECIES: hypothetical protein [Sphingomonas]|nr:MULTISPECIES: hypothetical protein [Sphingomonas]
MRDYLITIITATAAAWILQYSVPPAPATPSPMATPSPPAGD